MDTRCAYIALIGTPNAGKSTLLNQLIGSKISIVSPKVQTTRTLIRGICVEDNSQLIFVDTPGIFSQADRQLERAMVKVAWQGITDTNFIALLVDASKGVQPDTQRIIDTLKQQERKAILILNKIDLVKPPVLLALTQELNATGLFTDTFMVSALKGNGVADIRRFLAKQAPLGPWMYAEDEISDAPVQFLACEITREKLFLALQQELPYSLTVETELWERRDNGSIKIHQVIYVMRESQKKIILGHQGERIKRVGIQARKDIEELLDCKAHLYLFVKVKENWIDDPRFYKEMGLDGGK